MMDFYHIYAQFQSHGRIYSRSFSVVAATPEEAYDKGITRLQQSPEAPQKSSIAVSLYGRSVLSRAYDQNDYMLTLKESAK